MRMWILLPLIILGAQFLGAQAYVPFDLRIPAFLFMLLHIYSENFRLWDDDSIMISLAIVAVIVEFAMQLEPAHSFAFLLVGFQFLISGLYH